MLAHVVPMITGEDDDRVVGKAETFQRIDHPTDLGIHKTNAGVVGLPAFPSELVGKLVLFFLVAAESCRRQVCLILGHTRNHWHLLDRVPAEVRIFGSDIGRVGAKETNRQKKWPRTIAGTPLEDPFGIGCHHPIRMERIGFGRGVPTERAAKLAWRKCENLRLLFEPVDPGRVEFKFPGSGIVMAVGANTPGHVVVIELANAGRKIASLPEGLRQANPIGNCLPKDLPVLKDSRRVGIEPRQKGVSARPTEGKAAVGPLKTDTPRRQPIEVRRAGKPIAVAAEHIVEVIRNDEEHVGPLGRGGRHQTASHPQPENDSGHRDDFVRCTAFLEHWIPPEYSGRPRGSSPPSGSTWSHPPASGNRRQESP